MADGQIQKYEKKTRAWAKCSACRQRKGKCNPTSRDWYTESQKCEHCATHDLACGPSYTKNEDPAITLLTTNTIALEEKNIVDVGHSHEITALTTREASNRRSDSQMPTSVVNDDRADRKVVIPSEELREKAKTKLYDLNALGATLSQQSQSSTTYCQTNNASDPSDVASMKERLHLLFIDTYRLGAQAFESSYHDQARWIIYALLFALDRYPILHDGRRRDALSKMAVILRELGHQWEYEHVLEIASNIHNAVSPLPEEDPCLLLAASLPKTSEETKRVQENLWRETSVTNDVPHDLVYPAIHRAAQIRNGGVVATHLAHNHGIDRTLAIDNQQRSRVAKYLNITSDFVQARLEVDARNRCKRTALFLAAAQGLYQCCLSLIAALADPNTRDEHGHTILEVACKGGHLEVAKLLVGVGADINPQLMWCTSSPLQAAIESEKFSNKLVHFLIERGAYFTVQRLADGKTAIDIADDGGYSELADTMRFQHGGPSLFGLDMSYQSFDQAWYPRE